MEEDNNPYLDALCDVLDGMSQESNNGEEEAAEVGRERLEATEDVWERLEAAEVGRERFEAVEDSPNMVEATEDDQYREEVSINILNLL